MRGRSHLDAPYEEGTRRVAELSGELDRLRARLATDEAISESLDEYADRLRTGERDPARAHIVRAHRPASEVSSANIGLAAVATLIIIYEFFWPLVVASVLVVGLYVLWDNLRELRR